MDNRAIRTVEWTPAEVDGAGWELFQTATDPLETQNLAADRPEIVADLDRRYPNSDQDKMNNLARDPAHQAQLLRLHGILQKWTKDTADSGVNVPQEVPH